MTKILTIFVAFAVAFVPKIALAASSDWVSSGETRMRLVVAEPVAGDKNIRAALEVELAPGWKTYWQDPGDAGVPLQMDISGSQNLTLKQIHFPAPMRFDDGVTVWAGYNKPVQFPIEFERTDAVSGASLNANIFIGICEKICVPFQTSLSVTIKDAAASDPDQMSVRAAFDTLPDAATDQFGVQQIMTVGNKVHIETIFDVPSEAPELFLAAPRGWQFSAPKLLSVAGTRAQFEADILFAPSDTQTVAPTVAYTLLSAGSAVSGSIGVLK